MNQAAPIVGIDVSKATLAVCYQVAEKPQHLEVSNSKAGFQQLVRRCGVACCYVMEATGVYYLSLAYLPGRARGASGRAEPLGGPALYPDAPRQRQK
jgi:transposase